MKETVNHELYIHQKYFLGVKRKLRHTQMKGN